MEPGKRPKFAPGNQAIRQKQLLARARGLTTLSPLAAPTYMRPDIVAGQKYAGELLRMLGDHPVLHNLAGQVANTSAVANALLKNALRALKDSEKATAEGRTVDYKMLDGLLKTAQSFLREHRQALATLVALRGFDGGGGSMRETSDALAPIRQKLAVATDRGPDAAEMVVAGVGGIRQAIARATSVEEAFESIPQVKAVKVLEARMGETVRELARRLVDEAPAESEFAGVIIAASPGATVQDVVSAYYKSCEAAGLQVSEGQDDVPPATADMVEGEIPAPAPMEDTAPARKPRPPSRPVVTRRWSEEAASLREMATRAVEAGDKQRMRRSRTMIMEWTGQAPLQLAEELIAFVAKVFGDEA
jgi:hypothetical protein